MPQAGAIRAGRAFVELFADDAQLRKGLKGAADRLRAFGGVVRNIGLAFTAMGAGITAPLVAAAKGWAKAGDELYDMAQRTGLSVEQLSALSYAAAHTGADMGGVEVAVRRMQKSIAGVSDAGIVDGVDPYPVRLRRAAVSVLKLPQQHCDNGDMLGGQTV